MRGGGAANSTCTARGAPLARAGEGGGLGGVGAGGGCARQNPVFTQVERRIISRSSSSSTLSEASDLGPQIWARGGGFVRLVQGTKWQIGSPHVSQADVVDLPERPA